MWLSKLFIVPFILCTRFWASFPPRCHDVEFSMCLPFHLYACSKPSLFWFRVIKINWTFNLISEPCSFLCLFRARDGQLISKGESKVFLHFPPGPRPGAVSGETGANGTRDRQSSSLTPVSGCAEDSGPRPGCTWGLPGAFQHLSARPHPSPVSLRTSGGGTQASVVWKVVQVILIHGQVCKQVV